MSYLSGLVQQLKAQNPLNAVVAAGDLIGGSPLASGLFHDEPTIEALNLLGLDFSAVGNHEFDDGVAELLRMQSGDCFPGGQEDTCRNGPFKGAAFRYLAANVIDAASGKRVFPGYAVKSFDLRAGGALKVAFIGAVLRDTPSTTRRQAVSRLAFTDEADAANALIAEIRGQGIETIVLLIHEGGSTSASAFDDRGCPEFRGAIIPILDRLDPAIDVVISGHTHKSHVCRYKGRLVTNAGAQGRYLTEIDLRIDPVTRDVMHADARQLAAVNDTAPNPAPDRYPTVSADPRLQALLALYNAAAASLTERAIGRIEGDITRASAASGESALGDLIADAHLAATRDVAAGRAQIAFMNPSGIRADLRVGDGAVTYGEAFAVHPFGNALVTLSLTGEELHALLEQQWTRAGLVLQVSRGFSYEWDSAAPAGRKVDPGSILLEGAVVDPGASYRVTVNEFLAGGGDGFTVFAQSTERVGGMLDIEALERYLAAVSAVTAPQIERIRVR